MGALKIISIILISVFALIILFFCLKSHKFLRVLGLNCLLGAGVLAVIDLTTAFTGIHIPLNIYSILGCSAFGIPAVCGFLITPFLF